MSLSTSRLPSQTISKSLPPRAAVTVVTSRRGKAQTTPGWLLVQVLLKDSDHPQDLPALPYATGRGVLSCPTGYITD